ncbi:MAG: hypothetical protein JSS38_05005 [Nitrospira sp.]|nr:hypothetical protein [Nitrospira sp.]
MQCTIKNQRSSGLAGEIPFTEVFPELWVIQDEDIDRARRLLDDGLVLLPLNQEGWICPGCDERHENQFATCWKCGQEKSPAEFSQSLLLGAPSLFPTHKLPDRLCHGPSWDRCPTRFTRLLID